MNGPHTPAFSRDNRWTRLIERVGMQNAQDGKPAGRMIEQMAAASPLIPASRVRRMSPQEAARTDYRPEPEDARVAMMAHARAQALGISNDGNMPIMGDDLPGDIGHVAGEPTDAEIDAMLVQARGTPVHGAEVAAEGAAAPGLRQAPSPAAAGRAIMLPHGHSAPTNSFTGARSMPNFANVEGFDLTRKVAVVDGMEFKLAEDDVVAMKKFAIQVVLDNVTYQLAQALVQLGIPQEMAQATAEKMRETAAAASTPGGMSGSEGRVGAAEAVLAMHGSETNQSVQQEQGQGIRTLQRVPDMPKEAATTALLRFEGAVSPPETEETSEPEVQPFDQRSSEKPAPFSGEISPADGGDDLLGDGGISPS